MPLSKNTVKITALAGGVGGARLAHGLAAILPPEQLSIIVNTGDDFEHLGLTICPDLDTVLYTLAGIANPETGWGIAGDSFECLEALKKIGAPAWFRLGDRDFATHLQRSTLLKQGQRLTEVIHNLASALGVQHPILPMCDTPCRTMVQTDEGELRFQDYFVRRAWQPRMLGLRWEGVDQAQPSPEILKALQDADLVIFCPSNPFVSIDPILNLPGVRNLIAHTTSLAVSPIIGGSAVKGPAAKMFNELGIEPSSVAVAKHYQNLLTGFVLDQVDQALQPQIQALGLTACDMPSLMPTLPERIRVAQAVLTFGLELISKTAGKTRA
jgi:LPPG:FO 2-phospho-L-lactate transferase